MPTDPPTCAAAPTAASSLSGLQVKGARLAVRAVFFANGIAMATWVVNIPRVRDHLDLDPATIGVALLAIAAGSLIAMPRTGHLSQRYGTRRVTVIAAVLVALSLILPFLATSLWGLFAALLALGAANGVMGVAMNAQGVVVEREGRKPVMSSFHAAYSFGNLTGAVVGSLLLGVGLAPLPHALLIAGAFLALLAVVSRQMLPKSAETQAPEAITAVLPGAAHSNLLIVALLGGLCFLGMLGEGAIGDWSGLYSTDVLGVSGALVGAAFTAFTLAMTVARLLGDGWRSRYGDQRVVTVGALVSGTGLLLGLLTLNPLLAAMGFLVFGIGVANVAPVLYGTVGHAFAGKGIAQVAAIGYAGFLAGPPLIGLVSHATSLRVGMLVIGLSLLLVGVCAPLVYRHLFSGKAASAQAVKL